MTLGALGMRHCTGQLTLHAEGRQYCIVFDAGAVVGATSPMANDSAARVALVNHIIAAGMVPEIQRRIGAAPEREEIDVLAEVAQLSLDQKLRLRRKLIEQRAARTFAVDVGEFVIDSDVKVPIIPGLAIDVRSVIFHGARTILSEERVASELRPFGSHFALPPGAAAELPHFGFPDNVRPVLDALRSGTSFAALEAKHRDLDPRTVRAVVYALVSCSVCTATAPPPPLTLDLEPSPTDEYTRAARASSGATPSDLYSRTHTGSREVFVPRTGTAGPRTTTTTPPPSRTTTPPPSRTTTPPPSRTTTPPPDSRPPLPPGLRAPTAPPFVPGPRMSAPTIPPTDDGGNTPRALPSRTNTPTPPTPTRTQTPVAVSRATTPPAAPRTSTPNIPATTRAPTPPSTARTSSPSLPALSRTATPSPRAKSDTSASGPHRQVDPSASGLHRLSSGSTPPPNVAIEFKAPSPRPEEPQLDVVAAAREAFRRGQSALRDEALAEAIAEFTKAVEFTPNEVDYAATLAWARFCAASDKQNVAETTRNTLGVAIRKSQSPEIARFYLGRVERMLGRDREALRHFHEVLLLQPRHADAAAEIRVIEQRLASAPKDGGLFGRKR